MTTKPWNMRWIPAVLLGGLTLTSIFSWVPIVREILDHYGSITEALAELWMDQTFIDSMGFTLRTAFLGATLSGVLGSLLALGLVLWIKPSSFLKGLMVAPLFIPHMVAAQMLLLTLSPSGLLNRFLFNFGLLPSLEAAPFYLHDGFGWSVILGFVFKETPFVMLMVLPVTLATVQTFGPPARTLGASFTTLVLRVVLPNLWPAAALATLMGFAYGMVSYEIPLLLGKTYPKSLSGLSLDSLMDPVPSGRPLAFMIGLVLCGITLSVGLIFFGVQSRYRQTLMIIRQRSPIEDPAQWLPERLLAGGTSSGIGILLNGVFYGWLVMMVLPIVPLLFWSLTHSWPWPQLIPPTLSLNSWLTVFGLDAVPTTPMLPALGQSLGIATQVTLLSAVLSLPIARWLGQSRFVGQSAWETLALSPLFMPTFISAIGMGTYLLRFRDSLGNLPVVLIHSLAFSPYLIFNLAACFLTRGSLLEEAAASLGVKPILVFLRVSLPGVMPVLLRGALFVFLASLGDVVLIMMVQGHDTLTLPLILMPLISGGGGGGERSLASAGSLLLILGPLGAVGVGFLICRLQTLTSQRFRSHP